MTNLCFDVFYHHSVESHLELTLVKREKNKSFPIWLLNKTATHCCLTAIICANSVELCLAVCRVCEYLYLSATSPYQVLVPCQVVNTEASRTVVLCSVHCHDCWKLSKSDASLTGAEVHVNFFATPVTPRL